MYLVNKTNRVKYLNLGGKLGQVKLEPFGWEEFDSFYWTKLTHDRLENQKGEVVVVDKLTDKYIQAKEEYEKSLKAPKAAPVKQTAEKKPEVKTEAKQSKVITTGYDSEQYTDEDLKKIAIERNLEVKEDISRKELEALLIEDDKVRVKS